VARAQALGVDGALRRRLVQGEAVIAPGGATVLPRDVLGPPRPGPALAYCTDTVPCEGAVRLGRGVDLMIHEATFLEGHAKEAAARGHSTARQAAEVASAAGARRLALTHFSPRYDDLSAHLDEARAVFADTELAQELTAIELMTPG